MSTKDYWSSSIRPVTGRFPVSTDVLDESSLPFAVSLTPLAQADEHPPQYLAKIAKCLHCGAPHPTTTTHFRLGGALSLCYLCGHVSSTLSQEQQVARANEDEVEVEKKKIRGETFCLPLRISSSKSNGSSMYAVPAIACPPLWFIVLDGSCQDMEYWDMVETVLKKTLRQAPPHLHVSLLVASSTPRDAASLKDKQEDEDDFVSTLSLFQSTSEIPFFVQYSSEEACTDQGDLLQAVLNSCLPLESNADAVMSTINALPQMEAHGTALPVAWVTQVILSALEEGAVAAGRQVPRPNARPYAGGKLTFFLASRPAELGIANGTSTSPATWNRGSAFETAVLGGIGGRIHGTVPAGSRFESHDTVGTVSNSGDVEAGASSNDTKSYSATNGSEWTPAALADFEDWDLVYADLGQQCASASLGVDLYCCGDRSECGVAVALVDKSGSIGPLVVPYDAVESFEQEVLCRAPWNCVFGAELRVRLSQGFTVDTDPVKATSQKGKKEHLPDLSSMYSQAGLVGPACPVEDSSQLWRMGTCDPYTSFALDLSLQQASVKDRMLVNGVGEVALKPAIQTCFAYTTIVPRVDGDTTTYETVRRMRIASRRVPLARRVEELYDALDPEVLAMILFHKLALASFQEGYDEMPDTAEKWLQSLLVCAYRSAEDEDDLEKAQKEKGVENNESGRYFIASERLLDQQGDLSTDEVLLAQGHPKLALVPLMVYLLLQCDAFRKGGSPSLDLRISALWQMSSMVPTAMARAIAPRLQLWESGSTSKRRHTKGENDGPILDVMDLSSTAVQDAVMEYSQTTANPLLLFLDSPDQLLVLNASHIVTTTSGTKKKSIARVSKALQKAIDEAVESYRTAPTVFYELGDPQPNQTSNVLMRLIDIWIEDAPSPSGEQNFSAWRSRIARAVEEELDSSG